ncbi:uncharacterized, partial [Tachysurus ichikawai]
MRILHRERKRRQSTRELNVLQKRYNTKKRYNL